MKSIRLTKVAIKNLPVQDKPYYVSDTMHPYLFVRVGARSRTFYCIARESGLRIHEKLGNALVIAPEIARERATERLELGAKPRQSESGSSLVAHPTLSQAVAELVALRDLKPRTRATYGEKIKNGFSDWLDLPISEISERMILQRLKDFKARGLAPDTIHGLFGYLRAVLTFCKAQYKNEDGSSVYATVPTDILGQSRLWPRKTPRRNRIFQGQLKPFLELLQVHHKTHPVQTDLIVLWLLTGMRNSEARKLKRDNVDFRDQVIIVDRHAAKNRNQIAIPITLYTRPLLARRAAQSRSNWLFQCATKKNAPIFDVRQVQKLMAAEGIVFTPHDLRRTFISVGASLGLRDVAKAVANHKIPSDDITAQYMNWDVTELRGLLTQIQARILADMAETGGSLSGL